MTSVLWNSNVREAVDNFTAVKMKGVSRRQTDSFAGWNAGWLTFLRNLDSDVQKNNTTNLGTDCIVVKLPFFYLFFLFTSKFKRHQTLDNWPLPHSTQSFRLTSNWYYKTQWGFRSKEEQKLGGGCIFFRLNDSCSFTWCIKWPCMLNQDNLFPTMATPYDPNLLYSNRLPSIMEVTATVCLNYCNKRQ